MQPVHQGEIAQTSGGLLARAVGVFELLEGDTFQLRSSQDGIQLLAQRGTTRSAYCIEVADRLARVDEHDRRCAMSLGGGTQPLQSCHRALSGPLVLSAHALTSDLGD
jgi:hypothetical protein